MPPTTEDLHIIHYPDPRLRETARPVEEVTEEMRAIADRMLSLMHEANGVGLAATQVGIPLRLIVLRSLTDNFEDPPKDDAPAGLPFINPVIVAHKGYVQEEEGCLSVPGVRARIRRFEQVTIRAWDLDGEEHEIVSEGVIARIWQHEIDHLNGTLLIDKMSPASRIGNAKKLRELELAYGEP